MNRIAKDILERAGYLVVRSAGSHGLFDLVAISPLGVRLIQVKSNYVGPVEIESLQEFKDCPHNSTREIWLFRDGEVDPIIKVLK